MGREKTYWHMQMHPNNIRWEKENEILSRNIIGIGDWHDKKATSQIKALKSMKDGDIVLVKRGGTPLALVQVVGKFDSNKDEGYKIGGNEWIYYKRDVHILKNLLATEESRDKVPQPRGALQKSTDRNSKTYKYIDSWYKEIIEDIENNKIINIEEYQEHFTISVEELKKQLNKTDNIKYIDILNFYKESVKDIETIDIEIENLKNIKKLNEKFTIKLDNGLYTIVGNNGIGKSALLISLGHLVNHTFLQTEFKGDSFDDSKITYTFNNLVKFEWKKYNLKSKSWTIQNKKFDMPKIDGFFESGIISGTRFEHLNLKKEVLEKVDKNSKQIVDKTTEKNLDFIKRYLHYIITGKYEKEEKNKYNKLFTAIFDKNELYFNYDKSGKIISEYSFSTGEYFVLALLKVIIEEQSKSKKSLIIIDELDISLHPLAQERLIEKINHFSKKFNITFVVATHSLQIIENSKANNIYLFENNDGIVTIFNPIYPAYVTKNLYKHSYYDKVLLVEDELAEKFLKKTIEKIDKNFKYRLYFTIIPIGGWRKLLEVSLEKDKYYVNANVITILDKDIEEDLNKELQKQSIDELKKDFAFIPVEDNIEKFTLKKLFKNTKFHRYIESECLKDEYQFSNLDIREYEESDNSKNIKDKFNKEKKSLVKQIGDYSENKYIENYSLIEEKIVDFIFDELSDSDEYLDFEKRLKEFFEVENEQRKKSNPNPTPTI